MERLARSKMIWGTMIGAAAPALLRLLLAPLTIPRFRELDVNGTFTAGRVWAVMLCAVIGAIAGMVIDLAGKSDRQQSKNSADSSSQNSN